ncbi:hypothetical protein COMA2_30318 [Candidatus Nitrospira nitrificans]|uniref:Uncharacterized protein n=1 Tax=Candidatus Nitrospira nitrificans TaxID=1742973 RepID=A0A0S4LL98_9BACT|nr:hypothetical protein COMA2_30318 [Candidatus Nitrospira nitrificans]
MMLPSKVNALRSLVLLPSHIAHPIAHVFPQAQSERNTQPLLVPSRLDGSVKAFPAGALAGASLAFLLVLVVHSYRFRSFALSY